MERCCGSVTEAVAEVVRFEGPVEEQDARWECVRKIVFRGVKDAFAVRTEAAEGDSEGVAQVVGGRLGVVHGLVWRERCPFGSVDGRLGPGLGRSPRRIAWELELSRGLSAGFVLTEILLEDAEHFARPLDLEDRKSVHISNLKI
jgi:hypothetical protein